MSNDMKLIMENWRREVLSESNLKTYGDLKQALQGALKFKKGEIQKDAIKDTATGALLDFIPGGATFKSVFDLGKTLYNLPDEKRSNTGLDRLNVDDEVSAVVDDRVENQFIQKYLKSLVNMDDNMPLETTDMTKLLTKFIEKEYGSTKVEPGK